MTKQKSDFDKVADQLERNAASINDLGDASPQVEVISTSTDENLVGTYPQVKVESFTDDGGHYYDRFPDVGKSPMQLGLISGAKWTDILSGTSRFTFLLLNEKARKLFFDFDMHGVKVFDAMVRSKAGKIQPYACLFVANHLAHEDIDFERSECFLVDMASQPISKVEVNSLADYKEKVVSAREGTLPGSERFSRISVGKIHLLPGRRPKGAIFGMGRINRKMFVTTELADALRASDVTGVELERNRDLHF